MGVIYKLTDEVINYIISLKKQDMTLSCRSLAEMATEKYQFKISKSSVNGVLKSAQLSSSVGRRSGEANKFKKFIIPQEKKVNIRQEILEKTLDKAPEGQNQTSVEKIVHPNEVTAKPKINKLGASKEEIKDIIKNIENISKGEAEDKNKKEYVVNPSPLSKEKISSAASKNVPPKSASFKPVKSLVPSEYIEQHASLIQIQERKGHLYNGMGFVLLKAAEWEISDKPFLGNLFKKYVKGPWEKDFEKSCNALTILKMLGIEKLDDSFQYRYHALWRLSGFTDQPSFETIYDWSKYLELPQNLMMEYLNECRQIFMEVSSLQFILEDGSKIFSNASMTALADNLNISSAPLAMTKTLTILSQFLISPENMMFFHSCCTDHEFQHGFWDMISAFENIPNKTIQSIEIMSEAHVKMADFPVVINKKRFFAVGINGLQKEFKELSKTVHWAPKKQFIDGNKNYNFYFSDSRTNWFSERLNLTSEHGFRLITFWQENSDEPFWMIVTNNEQCEAHEIISQYLKKWPEYNQSSDQTVLYKKFTNTPNLVEEIELLSIWDVFKDFGFRLHQYVQQHFQSENIPKFSLNDYISDIYSLPGYLIENNKNLLFILSLPPSFKYYEDLLITIKKVNQAEVITHDKRSIRIEIDY